MSCNHKWVEYTSFFGHTEICCAKAGCGIKQSDYKPEPTKIKNQDLADAMAYAQWPTMLGFSEVLGTSWGVDKAQQQSIPKAGQTIKFPTQYAPGYDEFGHKKPDGKL